MLLAFALTALGPIISLIIGLEQYHLLDGFDFKPGEPLTLCGTTQASCISMFQGRFQTVLLFRFLPVNLFGWFGWLWLNADLFYRYMQPFAGMDSAAPATSNILLRYPTAMPVIITAQAISNGHWRVALMSGYSFCSRVAPILASDLFLATATSTGYHIEINKGNFWVCFVVLIVYLLTIPFIRPTPAYRLPRFPSSIVHVIGYCYASRIMDEKVFGNTMLSVQDATDERVHLESKIHLAKKYYKFGYYMGKDSKMHLGFDVAERQNEAGKSETVIGVDPGISIGGSCWRCWLRLPSIIQKAQSEA